MAPCLVAITGSIASGKSTVARALAARLRADRRRAATVDLDLVYEMLADDPKSDPAVWATARRLAGRAVRDLFELGTEVAVVEGELWTAAQRGELLDPLPPGVEVRWVALTVSFAEALRRASDDPTRGLSRDPAFLRADLDAWEEARRALPAGAICIDTGREGTAAIAERLLGLAGR